MRVVWYKYSIREVISQQRLLSFTVSKGTRTFPGTQMHIVYSTSFDFIHRTMYTTSPKNIYASSCTRTPSLTCTPPPPHTLSCVQRTSGAGRRSLSSFQTNQPAAATKRSHHNYSILTWKPLHPTLNPVQNFNPNLALPQLLTLILKGSVLGALVRVRA